MESGEKSGPTFEELRSRVGIKENQIRALHDQLAATRLDADESRASREAGQAHFESLLREKDSLRQRVAELDAQSRERRRGREGLDRQIERLQRELERSEGEVSRRDHLIRRRENELESLAFEKDNLVARKEGALEDALRRVAGLAKDLEEREDRISDLEKSVRDLRSQLEEEREARMRLAEPANRLRDAIDLFNESPHREAVITLSRSLGQPNVHVELERGEEPPLLLTFTWRAVTWQGYAANPGLGVKEPRVFLKDSGEDLSGVDEDPPNAHIGPGGRVVLGL